MTCPECRSRTGVTKVVHKRDGQKETTIRYLRCGACGQSWTTIEEFTESSLRKVSASRAVKR